MPLIQVQLLSGRSEEKIQKLILEITNTVVATLKVPVGNVRVVVLEVPKNNFGIGGKTAKELGR